MKTPKPNVWQMISPVPYLQWAAYIYYNEAWLRYNKRKHENRNV